MFPLALTPAPLWFWLERHAMLETLGVHVVPTENFNRSLEPLHLVHSVGERSQLWCPAGLVL